MNQALNRKRACQIAELVCQYYNDSRVTAQAIMAPQRGTPKTADLRAVCWWLWRQTNRGQDSATAIGAAFGRDRRNVSRGLDRISRKNFPSWDDGRKLIKLAKALK